MIFQQHASTRKAAVRAVSAFFCLLFLGHALSLGLWAREAPSLDGVFQVSGERIAGQRYHGPVTLSVTLSETDQPLSLWISDQGVWKLIPPQAGARRGVYSLSYTAAGDYELTFRIEDPQTLRHKFHTVSFSIDEELYDTLARIDALPNLFTATDREIYAAFQQILDANNAYSGLTEAQRALVSEARSHRVRKCLSWYANLVPSENYRIPEPPKITVRGEGPVDGVASDAFDLLVLPAAGMPTKIWMELGDGWREMPQMKTGEYAMRFNRRGDYRVRFCAVSDNGVRSPSVGMEFLLDPEVGKLLSEYRQLVQTAGASSPLERAVQTERLYRAYLALLPLQQAGFPADARDGLSRRYRDALQSLALQDTDYGADSRFVRAVGMCEALDFPPAELGKRPVKLRAERLPLPALSGDLPGTVLAGYRLYLEPDAVGGMPVGIRPGKDLLIQLQLPDDLLGKANIDMLHVPEDGPPVRLNAKARSTEDHLVLRFETQSLGTFAFVSLPREANPDGAA